VDAVGPAVDVVAIREIPPAKGLILGCPALGQPRDGARRQPGGLRPEQGWQGVPNVARGQAVQVQQGQDAGQTGRSAQVRRQDCAREPLPLALDDSPESASKMKVIVTVRETLRLIRMRST
jgi:hypothetical protein